MLKLMRVAALAFAGAFGMSWLLKGDLQPLRSGLIALAVVGGFIIGEWYRRRPA
jgi:hypothetical protein